MKILAIGDSHGSLEKIKKIPIKNIDLILLTGDIGKADLARKMFFENLHRASKNLPAKIYSRSQEKEAYMQIYNSTLNVIKYLSKFAPIYMIYGNVEPSNSEIKQQSKELGLNLPLLTDAIKKIKNTKIINNRKVKFHGITLAGIEYFLDTSWVEEFKPSDYEEILVHAKIATQKTKKELNKFRNVDILIAHQPPYRILDTVNNKIVQKSWIGKHAGSKLILDYIKKFPPKYVFCGHIHENKGKKNLGKTQIYNLGEAGYEIIEI